MAEHDTRPSSARIHLPNHSFSGTYDDVLDTRQGGTETVKFHLAPGSRQLEVGSHATCVHAEPHVASTAGGDAVEPAAKRRQ
jgi:hypothetical protein